VTCDYELGDLLTHQQFQLRESNIDLQHPSITPHRFAKYRYYFNAA